MLDPIIYDAVFCLISAGAASLATRFVMIRSRLKSTKRFIDALNKALIDGKLSTKELKQLLKDSKKL